MGSKKKDKESNKGTRREEGKAKTGEEMRGKKGR